MSLKVDVCRSFGQLTAKQACSYRLPRQVTRFIPHPGGLMFPLCPRCSRCLDREYLQYCNCCGQRLSWKKSAFR